MAAVVVSVRAPLLRFAAVGRARPKAGPTAESAMAGEEEISVMESVMENETMISEIDHHEGKFL